MNIVFCLFPDVTQLDLMGPLQVLSRVPQANTIVVSRSRSPVATDCGIEILPTCSLKDCPRADVLVIPGGAGVANAILDSETAQFLRRSASEAEYVGAVCTGVFLLGSTGLLHGKVATTHWAYTELLPLIGAKYKSGRVVRDGRYFTGSRVTSGIDLALVLAGEIFGNGCAESIQLEIEYNPDPPFTAGHPSQADSGVLRQVEHRYADRVRVLEHTLTRRKNSRLAEGHNDD